MFVNSTLVNQKRYIKNWYLTSPLMKLLPSCILWHFPSHFAFGRWDLPPPESGSAALKAANPSCCHSTVAKAWGPGAHSWHRDQYKQSKTIAELLIHGGVWQQQQRRSRPSSYDISSTSAQPPTTRSDDSYKFLMMIVFVLDGQFVNEKWLPHTCVILD